MGNINKLLFIGVLFILLFSLSHANYIPLTKNQSQVSLYYNYSTGEIKASISVFGMDYTKQIEKSSSENWQEAQEGNENAIEVLEGGFSDFSSIENAKIYILYQDKVTGERKPVEECNPIITDKVEYVNKNGENIPFYYGICQIDRSYIEGKCTQFFAKYEGKDAFYPSSTYLPLVICDNEGIPIFDKYTGEATKILTNLANDPEKNSICFISAILFGLLIASMYASGANPLSLLDISSPKLPSPKSFAASGSVLSPMSYGRMGKGIDEAKKSFDNFFKEYNRQSAFLGNSAYSSAPEYLKALYNRINSGRYDQNLKNKISNLLSSGVSAGTIGELRDILNEMKKRGGLDHSIASMAELRILGEEQTKYMAIFGGGADRGRSIARNIQTSKLISSPLNLIGKVPFAGHFVKSSVGNFFASAQFMKRITRSVVSSTAVSTTDVLDKFTRGKAGEIRQSIGENAIKAKNQINKEIQLRESGGIKGNLLRKIKAEALGMIESIALSSDGKYIDVGRIGNMPDFLKKQYEYFMEGALLDIDSYTLKKLFSKYINSEGIGQLELENLKTADFFLKLKSLIDALPKDKQAEIISLEQRLILKLNQVQRMDGESEIEYKLRRSEALISFAKGEGVILDNSLIKEFNLLNNLHHNSDPIEQKFIFLTDHLNNTTANAPTSAEFSYATYREHLLYGDSEHTASTDMWNRMLFKSFLENIAKGFAENSHNAGDSLLFNSMKLNYARTVNEMFGLDASVYQKNAKLQQIVGSAREYLHELLLPEGQKVKGGLNGALYNSPISGYGFGDWRESGPLKNWWKVDAKWFWLTNQDPGTSEERTVFSTVRGMFEKADYDPHYVDMERLAKRFGIYANPSDSEQVKRELREQKRGVYELGFLFERIKTHLNEDSMNAYGPSGRQVTDYYKTILAESIRRYVEHFAPDEIRNHFKNQLNSLSSKEIIDSVKKGYLKDIIHLMTHGDENGNHKYFGQNLTFNSYQKGVWARTNEGYMVAVNEEVPLSSMDIILNGTVAYRDLQGTLRKFDPEKFEKLELRKELIHAGEEGKNILTAINHGQYSPELLDNAKGLVNTGKISAGAYTAIAYNYAKQTHDWSPINTSIRDANGQPLIKLMSTDDYLSQKSGVLGSFGRFFKSAGYAVERNFLNVFGSNARALDAVNDISALYRSRYHSLSADILGGHLSQSITNPSDMSLYKSLESNYKDVAQKLFKYQTAWDFTIDRHPTGSSTAQGRMFWMESFYHLGPKMPFNIESHSPYYSNPEKGGMFFQNIFVKMQRWAMVAPVSMYRGFKVGTEGTPTTYDFSGSPMERWTFKQPSLLEGMRSLLNPLYSGINWRAPFGAIAKTPSYFLHHAPVMQHITKGIENKLDEKGYTSPLNTYESKVNNWVSKTNLGDPFQKGLLGRADSSGYATQPSKELFALARENSSYWAVTANANPAQDYYDSRRTLRPDVSASSHLVYTSTSPAGTLNSFYSGDEQLKNQAASNLVKRTVSPLLHVIEREGEYAMYGSFSGSGFKRRAMMVDPLAISALRIGTYVANKYSDYKDAKSLNMSVKEYSKQVHPNDRSIKQWFESKIYNTQAKLKYGYQVTAPHFMGGIGNNLGKGGIAGRVYCSRCRSIKTRGASCPNCGSI